MDLCVYTKHEAEVQLLCQNGIFNIYIMIMTKIIKKQKENEERKQNIIRNDEKKLIIA